MTRLHVIWAASILIVVALVAGGLWFADWYPGSELDDRPTCSGMGVPKGSNCWTGPWP